MENIKDNCENGQNVIYVKDSTYEYIITSDNYPTNDNNVSNTEAIYNFGQLINDNIPTINRDSLYDIMTDISTKVNELNSIFRDLTEEHKDYHIIEDILDRLKDLISECKAKSKLLNTGNNILDMQVATSIGTSYYNIRNDIDEYYKSKGSEL